MDPLYLQAMIHGEGSNKKPSLREKETMDRFEISLEKQIDTYVDAMELDENPAQLGLLTPKLRREKIKKEMKDAVKMQELLKLLESALTLLLSKESPYLTEMYTQLETDFSMVLARIQEMNLDQPIENLDTVIEISNEGLHAIAHVALDKFQSEHYFECLSLFTLLSVLSPSNAEYWLRLGISAQKLEKYELAQNAYAAALNLDSKLVGAKLFNAECYLHLGKISEAKEEYKEAVEIARQHKDEIDKVWFDLFPVIKELIGSSHYSRL